MYSIDMQKVPQATVPLGPGFAYTLGGLYMSFSDKIGNNWSALFDAESTMTNFVRMVMSAIAHVASHQEVTSNGER